MVSHVVQTISHVAQPDTHIVRPVSHAHIQSVTIGLSQSVAFKSIEPRRTRTLRLSLLPHALIMPSLSLSLAALALSGGRSPPRTHPAIPSSCNSHARWPLCSLSPKTERDSTLATTLKMHTSSLASRHHHHCPPTTTTMPLSPRFLAVLRARSATVSINSRG